MIHDNLDEAQRLVESHTNIAQALALIDIGRSLRAIDQHLGLYGNYGLPVNVTRS